MCKTPFRYARGSESVLFSYFITHQIKQKQKRNMQVFVRKNTRELGYTIEADWTAEQLKELVREDFRIEPTKYELTHEGDPMADKNLLMSYGLFSDAQLMLELKPIERVRRHFRHTCRKFNRDAAMNCCSRGDLERLKLILFAGFDIEAESTSKGKSTFLTVAVKCKRYEMVEYLLKEGFDPNHYTAININRVRNIKCPLKYAVEDNDPKMIKILHQYGCNLNGVDTCKPLFLACKKNRLEALQCFIDLGANLLQTNIKGQSLLQRSVLDSNLPATKLLIKTLSPGVGEISDLYSAAICSLVGRFTKPTSYGAIIAKCNMAPDSCKKEMFLYFKNSPIIPRKGEFKHGGPCIHWAHMQDTRTSKVRILEQSNVMDAEDDADDIFDFLYSRGNTRSSNKNRYGGRSSTAYTPVNRKYRKHHSYV